jgi:hypothetical protein
VDEAFTTPRAWGLLGWGLLSAGRDWGCHRCAGARQVRAAVVSMLDAWAGDGRVPAEKLLPAVYEALAAPKASAEGKLAALRWIGSVVEAGRIGKGTELAVRAAAFGSADKTAEAREAANALFKALLQVRAAPLQGVEASSLGSVCLAEPAVPCASRL